MQKQPNLVFVFGDQWRAQALGYAGDTNATTPNIDSFAAESVNFSNAVAGTPVCCPFRATLMTGQEPLTHGLFVNDVNITSGATPLGNAFQDAGYATAYIGKWHIDGNGRQAFVPPERRMGFQFWRGFECTHDYNASDYYADTPEKLRWPGYDAEAQTDCAVDYIRQRGDAPFVLFLSWGPPHAPYHTAPEKYRKRHRAEDITLRPNVPAEEAESAREQLAGYYAHIEALDQCFAKLLACLEEEGIDDDTIVVFASDHGDLLGSQGGWKKQQPFEESIHIPFLVRYPAAFGRKGRTVEEVLNAPDIMPTLLGLCGAPIPDSVQGTDASPLLRGERVEELDGALLACHFPFHQWHASRGGREYRGVRTTRYTYCRDLNGPWLLFDNQEDPYQLENLVDRKELAEVQAELEALLCKKLAQIGDEFRPGTDYLREHGIPLNAKEDIAYFPDRSPRTLKL